MADLLQVFLTGVEEVARTMKEHTTASAEQSSSQKELIEKVGNLTEKVDRLVNMLDEELGTNIQIAPAKGKRMMDIKKRIHDVIEQQPEGIRPPQIARIIGTRVQNLYPHLKTAVLNKTIIKNESGTYSLIKAKSSKVKKTA